MADDVKTTTCGQKIMRREQVQTRAAISPAPCHTMHKPGPEAGKGSADAIKQRMHEDCSQAGNDTAKVLPTAHQQARHGGAMAVVEPHGGVQHLITRDAQLLLHVRCK